MEGTGCDGAALARFLCDHGQVVLEVNRPQPPGPPPARQVRPAPLDAEAAVRAVQAGEVQAGEVQAGEVATVPKAGNATVEMIRSLRVARQTSDGGQGAHPGNQRAQGAAGDRAGGPA